MELGRKKNSYPFCHFGFLSSKCSIDQNRSTSWDVYTQTAPENKVHVTILPLGSTISGRLITAILPCFVHKSSMTTWLRHPSKKKAPSIRLLRVWFGRNLKDQSLQTQYNNFTLEYKIQRNYCTFKTGPDRRLIQIFITCTYTYNLKRAAFFCH